MDKFTPGPWRVYQEKPHYYSVGTDYAHDRGRDQNIVRDVRNESNARLMAAAPELMKALRNIVDSSDAIISALENQYAPRNGEGHFAIDAMPENVADAYANLSRKRDEAQAVLKKATVREVSRG